MTVEDLPSRISHTHRQVLELFSASHATIDLLVDSTELPIALIFPDAMLLDESDIDRLLYDHLNRIGSFPLSAGGRFAQEVGKRIAGRLAKRAMPNDDFRAETFSDAWLFLVWRELSTLIPLRHLARQLTKLYRDRVFLIRIKTTQFRYLNYYDWTGREGDYAPLVLAAVLKKLGARAFLVLSNDDAATCLTEKQEICLQIEPSPIWRTPGPAKLPHRQGAVAVIGDGIRNINMVLTKLETPLSVDTSLFGRSTEPDMRLWGSEDGPCPWSIRMIAKSASDGSTIMYSSGTDWYELGELFINSVFHMSCVTLDAAERSVAIAGIRELHMCDCFFFESAIVANVVKRHGGKIHIWPHSINETFLRQHRALPSTAVTSSVTVSAQRHWEKRFPKGQHLVHSEAMLSPRALPHSFTLGEPVSVVIFAGSHSVARMPLLPLKAHEATWRKLLISLAAAPDHFRLIVKMKGDWETLPWLQSLFALAPKFEETTDHALSIDRPNMVFVSVSLASAALLEGLGRGIPCMIARETFVEDYMTVDPGSCPIGSVDQILRELEKCRDSRYYYELAEKQLVWYSSETRFS